ncbi:MAG: RimK/LysX family protein [Methylophilaceae bacterium]|nr:RimK/LysX family protein [Methylophilaceae bacterium]
MKYIETFSKSKTVTNQPLNQTQLLTFGWREWVKLPELGLPAIKAKVDTGARTSALHAFNLRPFTENGIQRIEFSIHPKQKDSQTIVTCQADILDKRIVSDSGGHKEERWVITTMLAVGEHQWPIEMTLTARDHMKFRMLLGRTALENRAVVDATTSYLAGKRLLKTEAKR